MGMLLRRYHNNSNGAVKNTAPVPVVEETKDKEIKYSKMDIYRMNGNDVRKLAINNGIEIEDLTVVEIKKKVCDKLIED